MIQKVPQDVVDMEWYVQFFLTNRIAGKRPRAGLLHFAVDVRPYQTVHYATAGTSTIIHMYTCMYVALTRDLSQCRDVLLLPL